jgi:hypothetical protein
MWKFINFRKLCSLLSAQFVSLQTSLEVENKKGFFRRSRWRFSKKAKGLIVFAIITLLLVSVFAFFPKQSESKAIIPLSSDDPTASPSATPHETNNQTTNSNSFSAFARAFHNVVGSAAQVLSPSPEPKAPGVIASAQVMNNTVWRAVAANAWKYFQPEIGVDSNTGLLNAGYGAPYFTDWDLGVYIQAVIDAQKIGLIGTDGDWGFNARMDKVLTFLETRELNSTTHYPYWFYQAADGKNYHADSDLATSPVDAVDTGRLFVALNNLRAYNSSWAQRVNNFVYNSFGNRSNYAALVPSVKSDSLTSTSIYAYYVESGFASFWPNDLSNVPGKILNNIFSSGTVTTYGNVSLPKAAITGDPLLCSVFELNNNDSRLIALANQVYLAHEAYYNDTGQYRAFSEGPSITTQWMYEWVVLPDNRTWVVLNENNQDSNLAPMIYSKVAMSYLAIYNTTFATNMAVYLENALPDPVHGYCEGVDESGTLLTGVGSNTNSLILDAALYAIQNNP